MCARAAAGEKKKGGRGKNPPSCAWSLFSFRARVTPSLSLSLRVCVCVLERREKEAQSGRHHMTDFDTAGESVMCM